jgi:hypothetical protein
MISGQMLSQEFNDKKSCDAAGKMLLEEYNVKIYHCVQKGDAK